MPTKNSRRWLTLLFASVWVGTHIPFDYTIYKMRMTDALIYSFAIQTLELILGVILFYSYLENRDTQRLLKDTKRPWKCPGCDGWGKRVYIPGMGKDNKAMLEICVACKGSGVVWEIIA